MWKQHPFGNHSDSPFLCGGGEGSWRGGKSTFEGVTLVLCSKGREELYGNHGECDSPTCNRHSSGV